MFSPELYHFQLKRIFPVPAFRFAYIPLWFHHALVYIYSCLHFILPHHIARNFPRFNSPYNPLRSLLFNPFYNSISYLLHE
ncbi:hypothetical protein CW304_19485 [Bacillus sp. UFRGS-B20]|nr:hypothetical protein CW304_19485 [Bacillus sp. UFRGS-B20]